VSTASIAEATQSYETWLRRDVPVVEAHLVKKHALMAEGAFELTVSSRDGADVERGHLGDRIEIAIVVGHRQSMSQGTRGDQAVDGGPDGVAGSAGSSIEANRLVENFPSKGRFDDRKGQHGIVCYAEGGLVAEALEHLLDDREARHDLVDFGHRRESQPARPPEHLDPDRGVNENHAGVAG
jgi:hypothetical protein